MTNKVTILVIIATIAIFISLAVTRLFTNSAGKRSLDESNIKFSYAIMLGTWLIPYSLLNLKALSIINEYLDMMLKIGNPNTNFEIVKTSTIYIGLTGLWLILWYYISLFLSRLFLEKRKAIMELENDNHTFFVIRGLLFLTVIYTIMPIFEIILRTFYPNIEIPFYN